MQQINIFSSDGSQPAFLFFFFFFPISFSYDCSSGSQSAPGDFLKLEPNSTWPCFNV